jgi:hypothetical protein
MILVARYNIDTIEPTIMLEIDKKLKLKTAWASPIS